MLGIKSYNEDEFRSPSNQVVGYGYVRYFVEHSVGFIHGKFGITY